MRNSDLAQSKVFEYKLDQSGQGIGGRGFLENIACNGFFEHFVFVIVFVFVFVCVFVIVIVIADVKHLSNDA